MMAESRHDVFIQEAHKGACWPYCVGSCGLCLPERHSLRLLNSWLAACRPLRVPQTFISWRSRQV